MLCKMKSAAVVKRGVACQMGWGLDSIGTSISTGINIGRGSTQLQNLASVVPAPVAPAIWAGVVRGRVPNRFAL